MRLFTFWSRRTQQHHGPDGRLYQLIAYAGSDASPAAAQQAADDKLRQRIGRLERGLPLGQYPVGTAPLREALVQRLVDSAGEVIGAVTRNRYGSRVLNTTQTMMLDVDLNDLRPQYHRTPRPHKSLWQLLQAWFAPAPVPQPPAAPTAEPRAVLEAKLQEWLREHPTWNFRLYRTRLGFRLLITHAPLAPNGSEAARVFQQLPVDPIYARLCRSQACYRARLSPKPWRIGLARPAQVFPYATEAETAAQAQWEHQYEERSQQFAVCELLGNFGSGYVAPEAAALLAIHDAACLGTGRLA